MSRKNKHYFIQCHSDLKIQPNNETRFESLKPNGDNHATKFERPLSQSLSPPPPKKKKANIKSLLSPEKYQISPSCKAQGTQS